MIRNFTDEEVAEARGLFIDMLDGCDPQETPFRHAMLHRTIDIIDDYKSLRANMQEIYHLPGRQHVGHPWLSRLTAILRETFYG